MKKIKLIFKLIILLIILIILGIFIFNFLKVFDIIPNNSKIIGEKGNNLNKIENYTNEEIKEILNKKNNIKNYECKYEFLGDIINEKYNGNILIKKMKTGTVYIDYVKEENILIVETKKEAIKVKIDSNILVNEYRDILKTKKESVLEMLEDSKYNYRGKTKEEYNSFNCVVIEFDYKFDTEDEFGVGEDLFGFREDLSRYNGEEVIIKVWIDEETGAIMKTVRKMQEKEAVQEFDYKFNKLEAEDFELNLDGYNIIEY